MVALTDSLARVSWSLVASMQAFMDGRKSFFACRALLGLIEGGFIVRAEHPSFHPHTNHS